MRVKAIRDKAEAIRAYARQAKNKQLEVDAAELHFRAGRRLGEMMIDPRTTIGMATSGEHGGRPKKDGLQKTHRTCVLL
jgi:hypothetical protein